MSGFSPPPPPQVGKALVRQLLNRRAGPKPIVAATLLDHPQEGWSSLEFANEGGPAEDVTCLATVAGRMQEIAVGSLAPGETKAIRVDEPPAGEYRCVWVCSDRRGRRMVSSYDGRQLRMKGRQGVALGDAFRELYPSPGS
jgi:hypothetical protein